MVMPASGTFDYVVVVPDDPKQQGRPWPARLRSVNSRDETLSGTRLVGLTPRLQITDAGPTPNAGWNRGRWLPSVPRGRMTLSASSRRAATVASASFHVDMGLIRSFQPGDIVNLARTGTGGLGISVVRGETLLAAVGAVTAVPLGNDLVACYPGKVMQAVEALFRERDPMVELPEVPIEIRIGDQIRILFRANLELGPYRVFMIHGFYSGTPGTDGCAAITRVGAGPEIAANSSAQLLDGGEIELVSW